jgi:hypothetical protein
LGGRKHVLWVWFPPRQQVEGRSIHQGGGSAARGDHSKVIEQLETKIVANAVRAEMSTCMMVLQRVLFLTDIVAEGVRDE